MADALIFDLDGTLADSDPLHRAVFTDMLAPHGITVDEAYYTREIQGGRNTEVFARLLPGCDAADLDRRKEAAYRARVAQVGLAPTPGLIAFLDRVAFAGWPMAIATNACRANIDAMLDALGISGRFAAIVSADDVARAKPHPDPFLQAARSLGVAPARALVFEDSAPGIAAARAAGCPVIGVATSLDRVSLLRAGATHAIGDFNDPALAELVPGEAPARA